MILRHRIIAWNRAVKEEEEEEEEAKSWLFFGRFISSQ
jgi:hypothetical protein